MNQRIIIVLLVSVSLLAGCASVAGTSGTIVIHDENVSIGISFTDRDRQIIHSYYKSHRGKNKKHKTPPGLAKRDGDLPHGLAKRDQLPPGLHARGLPGDLESQLTVLPKGYLRVIVGGDVVIMNRNTRVVIDIYRDVVN